LFPEMYAHFGQSSLLLTELFLAHLLTVVYLTCCVNAYAWKRIVGKCNENFQYVNT